MSAVELTDLSGETIEVEADDVIGIAAIPEAVWPRPADSGGELPIPDYASWVRTANIRYAVLGDASDIQALVTAALTPSGAPVAMASITTIGVVEPTPAPVGISNVIRSGTGFYTVTLMETMPDGALVLVTPRTAARACSADSVGDSGVSFVVRAFDLAGASADTAFMFTVFRGE